MGGKAKKTAPSPDFDAALLNRMSMPGLTKEIDAAARRFTLALGESHPLAADSLYLRSLAYHFLISVLFVEEHFGTAGEVRVGHIAKALSRIESARTEFEAAHEAMLNIIASLSAVTELYADDGHAIIQLSGEPLLRKSIEDARRNHSEIEQVMRGVLAQLQVPAKDSGGPSLTEQRRGRSAERFGRHLAKHYTAQGRGLYGSGEYDFAETLRALWRAADGGDLPSEAELLSRLRQSPEFLGPPPP